MEHELPSRPMRALLAWVGFSSVHFAAGRPLRGLFWIALLLASIALLFRLPLTVFFVVAAAQIVDAVLITPRRDRSIAGYEIAMLIAAVSGIVFAVALRFFWVEAFKIPSGAMIPTLQVGDHLFVDKSDKHPRRGEVAVFVYPKDPAKDFIKRVVAVGGDTIEGRDGALVVNGAPVPRAHVDGPCEYEDYLEDMQRWEPHQCDAWDETLDGHSYRVFFDRDGSGGRSWGPTTVPAGSYFVVGDNRDNSSDSRVWGFVPQDHIKGVARKLWWSSGPHGVRWDRLGKPIR